MKMDFLPDGSPDCPLIRLYDFNMPQAYQFHNLLLSLANGEENEVPLQEALWVEAVAECRLALQAVDRDQGIVWDALTSTFFCRLCRSSWHSIAKLVLPFCLENVTENYQWLDETSRISWLLSPKGLW